mmetsp:Transcript_6174/g.7101  ORF Transcript_6174/g.7101 Transcript_6174/m.7101 type:complete len:98 (-) Transcript_6174:1514-1807(-)
MSKHKGIGFHDSYHYRELFIQKLVKQREIESYIIGNTAVVLKQGIVCQTSTKGFCQRKIRTSYMWLSIGSSVGGSIAGALGGAGARVFPKELCLLIG